MGPIFSALGISVAVVNSQNTSFVYDPSHKNNEENEENKEDDTSSFMVQYEYLRPCSRVEAYACDITYGTNNEFGSRTLLRYCR